LTLASSGSSSSPISLGGDSRPPLFCGWAMRPLVKYLGPIGWLIRAGINLLPAAWDACKAIGCEFSDAREVERTSDPWKYRSKWHSAGVYAWAAVKGILLGGKAFLVRVGTGRPLDHVYYM
jgi:hypothetical protein